MGKIPNQQELELAIEIFGQEWVNEIANQLTIADKVASSKLIRSLGSKVRESSNGQYTIRLLAANHFQYVDSGRSPGTFPPLQAISRWVELKGISQDAVFPIMKSIQENGIAPANITIKSIQAMEQSRAITKFDDDVFDWTDEVIDNLLKKAFVSRSSKLGKVTINL